MKLHTKIELKKKQESFIDYNSKILLLGSCFSENIGTKLDYFKFQNLQNPFGILFHPIAIENLVKNTVNKKEYTEKDLIENNAIFHSFDAHSCLSSVEKLSILNNLNSAILKTHNYIKKVSHVIITLGTSWIYKHIETDKIVANCHKIPQKRFSKELLTIHKIIESLNRTIQYINSINKNATIVFTISPVRHLKDGFVENTQSKAHLITGVHKVISQQKNAHYFPSYEIMMDELRDYRFYKPDMIHPNQVAIDYIWEKFLNTWFLEANFATMMQVDNIQKGLQHRPFQKNSEQHQKFLRALRDKIDHVQLKNPHIIF